MARFRTPLQKIQDRVELREELRTNERVLDILAYRLANMEDLEFRKRRGAIEREIKRAENNFPQDQHAPDVDTVMGMEQKEGVFKDLLSRVARYKGERRKRQDSARGNMLITDFFE